VEKGKECVASRRVELTGENKETPPWEEGTEKPNIEKAILHQGEKNANGRSRGEGWGVRKAESKPAWDNKTMKKQL